MAAEDLISVVFPDQLACAENLHRRARGPGPSAGHARRCTTACTRRWTSTDSSACCAAIERGETRVIARDLPHPSPLAMEILDARPYAYLDDAPLEERRTQAVASRRWLDPQTAAEFGRLDPKAIAAVREEAWPVGGECRRVARCADARSASFGRAKASSRRGGSLFEAARRAIVARATVSDGEHRFWVAAEQLPMLAALYPRADQPIRHRWRRREYAARTWTARGGLVELVRGRLQAVGPGHRAGSRAITGRRPRLRSIRRSRRSRRGLRAARQFTAEAREHSNGASAACCAHTPLHHPHPARGDRARSAPRTSCASCSTGRA